MQPVQLKGYSYSIQDGIQARDNGKLLCLRVETSLLCNLRCCYCAWDSGEPLEEEIEFDTLATFISEGKDLGIESVIIVGGGEPTIYKYFRELVALIHRMDIIPVVITNGVAVTQELSDFMYINNCSVLLKYDSFVPAVQDYLVGVDGANSNINKALDCLIESGFSERDDLGFVRMGLSFVVTAKNIVEVPEFWRLCRGKSLYPNLELLNPIGRVSDLYDELVPDSDMQAAVLSEVRKMDEEYGISHYEHDHRHDHCLQHIYSVYLNVRGFIQPCGAIRANNVPYKEGTLKETLADTYFKNVRNTHQHLDENVELTIFNVT